MELELDTSTREAIESIRSLGREFLRPLGIEADRLERPIPPDHEFFRMLARSGYMERGPRSLDAAGGLDDERSAAGGRRSTGRPVRNVLVSEEGAYWDRGAMVTLPGPGLGGPPVASMGTPEQKERFLGIFATRERPLWAAFAMTEPGAGSDVARIATRARRDGDEWVLTGQKMFSSNSARAEWVVAWATVDPDAGRNGHRAFVVERGTPGFEVLRVEHKMGVRAYETASFALDDCRVPAGNLLGGEEFYAGRANRGFGGAMQTFNATRPVVAVHAVGIARSAHDHARDFVRDEMPAHSPRRRRRALERLATIRRGIEVGRLLCVHAAALIDAGKPNGREAATAKMYGRRSPARRSRPPPTSSERRVSCGTTTSRSSCGT